MLKNPHYRLSNCEKVVKLRSMDKSRLKPCLRKWTGIALCLLIVALVGLAITLKPYKDQAESFDLAELPQSNALDLSRLPQHVIDAVVASEDSRFFDHGGLDMKGICRAALVNLRSKESRQGGSTITQQLARQTYGILEKSMERKLIEAFLARRIERTFDKETILSNYLSVIYFGNGYSGIEAAADGYFNKAVEDLTVTEGATLAGLIKAPSALEPFRYPGRAKEARDLVLGRMAAEELLSEDEADRLQKQPIRTRNDAVAAPM